MRVSRLRFTVRGLMVLVIGCALAFWVISVWPENSFKLYLNIPLMDEHARWQSHAIGEQGGAQVLKLTIFPTKSPKIASKFQLDASGRSLCFDDIYNWARQGSSMTPLGDADMKEVREAILALPASDPPPPLGKLLMVGFDIGRGWTTRLYDRSKATPEVLRLCELVRFPIRSHP